MEEEPQHFVRDHFVVQAVLGRIEVDELQLGADVGEPVGGHRLAIRDAEGRRHAASGTEGS